MDRFEQAASSFAELCRVLATLRAPGGCPWDRAQTLQSLKPYLIEETYEAIEAIEQGNPQEHCKELGDVLLQVVFQADIAWEQKDFGMAEVCQAIVHKLVSRHPHVFGNAEQASTAQEALERWEAQKKQERAPNASVLEGIPRALPGLLRAYRTSQKASAVGFDWPSIQGSLDKVHEELGELEEALGHTPKNTEAVTEELGDLLFAVVNLSRHASIDPEEALRLTIDKFHRRFTYVEQKLQERHKTPQTSTLEEMDALWNEAKRA
jgi:tetrapyrrole methylase family protein/MazG family protein